ncbi:sterol desaturase family protein [Sporobolomyces koalae]|uniref:sterol desaturase family protein n=1 Tax=Sporobolomyces koalae TaxID=500713 RepID=UPI00316CE132
MYSTSAIDSAARPQVTKPEPVQRRASSGSLTDSECSSSSLETPISYATDPDDKTRKPPRTTRQQVDRRPPSTFYLKKKTQMNVAEFLCNLATCPASVHELKDEEIDRGPLPTHPIWKENVFILTRGLAPLVVQQLSYYFFPNYKWPLALAYTFYFHAFVGFALSVVHRLNHYLVYYGTFDEKNIGRDRTPDKSVTHLAIGILAYMFVRTAVTFGLRYDKQAQPINFSWYYPLKLAAWEVTLDYLFYCYHRLTHENDFLWSIHSHHHTTKHPTPILSILAESRQEFLEVFSIPLATSLLVPMSFSELYLTMCYTIYVEMMGHSGVRAYWTHPVLGWILRPFGMDLIVEDHDLHHRFGKSGKNYGKQTRIYDRIWGTCADRIESYGL